MLYPELGPDPIVVVMGASCAPAFSLEIRSQSASWMRPPDWFDEMSRRYMLNVPGVATV
jgi:hypothetical protein